MVGSELGRGRCSTLDSGWGRCVEPFGSGGVAGTWARVAASALSRCGDRVEEAALAVCDVKRRVKTQNIRQRGPDHWKGHWTAAEQSVSDVSSGRKNQKNESSLIVTTSGLID